MAWLPSGGGAPSFSPPPVAKLGPIPLRRHTPIPSASVLSPLGQRTVPGSQSAGLDGYAFLAALLTPIHHVHRPRALLGDAAKNQVAVNPSTPSISSLFTPFVVRNCIRFSDRWSPMSLYFALRNKVMVSNVSL
jgi:hypothetical protein